jgi:hypothetical protein
VGKIERRVAVAATSIDRHISLGTLDHSILSHAPILLMDKSRVASTSAAKHPYRVTKQLQASFMQFPPMKLGIDLLVPARDL